MRFDLRCDYTVHSLKAVQLGTSNEFFAEDAAADFEGVAGIADRLQVKWHRENGYTEVFLSSKR